MAGLDVVKEYSYTTGRSSGDGWVLVGDSWGFIDPIYSSGVYFALKSGQLAADAIIEGLRSGDTSAAQLGKWVKEFARRHELGPQARRGLVLRAVPCRQIHSRVSAASGR